MIRGWFEFKAGAQLIAVSWDRERRVWINLIGEPVPESAVLKAWAQNRRRAVGILKAGCKEPCPRQGGTRR